MDQGKLYLTQISMTEWFAGVGHKQTGALRDEDNKKRERLKIIQKIISIPVEEQHKFPATDVAHPSPAFKKYVTEHSQLLCSLRLRPNDPSLPRLRMRGQSVRDTLAWFNKQKIDHTKYIAEFGPHSELPLYSTIFVVNERGIFGEIIKGYHFQLTQGFYDEHKPVSFSYDFKTWRFTNGSSEYKKWMKEVTSWLHVTDKNKQQKLKQALNATFSHDYLQGYFETVTNEDTGLWFTDYNRILGKMFADLQLGETVGDALLKGQPASKGKATGKVKIVLEKDLEGAVLDTGDILVCDITTPAYLPLMQKAAAVVTDRGGILSHAAIVCRELGKPCVAATGTATSTLKNGQSITVDADQGLVIEYI